MFIKKIDNNLTLALIHPSFAEPLYAIVDEQRIELSTFLPWVAQVKDASFLAEFATNMLYAYAKGEAVTCAMLYDNEAVGIIGINSIDTSLQKTNLGYWLSQHYRGRGIVTKATQAMMDIAFNDYGLTKIEIKAAVNNHASRAVAERLGFTLEGVITQDENVNGALLDKAVYGLHKQVLLV